VAVVRFSPDGRYVASALTRIVDKEQQNAHVYVMRVDGSGRRNVTNNARHWDSAPDWSVRA
jgi:Tol biopolymer transport system component